MYMPGRLRTGSSPSRTVMSFAEYEDIGREHSHTTWRPARVALTRQSSILNPQSSILLVDDVEAVLGEVERLLTSEAGRRHPSFEILQRVAHLVVSRRPLVGEIDHGDAATGLRVALERARIDGLVRQ